MHYNKSALCVPKFHLYVSSRAPALTQHDIINPRGIAQCTFPKSSVHYYTSSAHDVHQRASVMSYEILRNVGECAK